MDVYRTFTKQTDSVVVYLKTARMYQTQTRVEVPNLKHAPVNLGKQLEDYLSDPDFDINRRQYIAEQQAKKGVKGANNGKGNVVGKLAPPSTDTKSRESGNQLFPDVLSSRPPTRSAEPMKKGPDPDLIDFFDSIEQNQQPTVAQVPQQGYVAPQGFAMQQPQQFQQNGFSAQQTGFQNTGPFQQQQPSNGFTQPQPQQLQPNFTGAGFGGYTPQPSFQPGSLAPIPQDNAASFQSNQSFQQMGTGQQQTTNPFRMSMMAGNPTGIPAPQYPQSLPVSSPIAPQSTNPFAKRVSPQQTTQQFSPPPDQIFQQQQQQQQQPPQAQSLQPMQTGTNPFARNMSQPAIQTPPNSGSLMPQPTGSTNPFRQSAFVNTATGTGWQHNQQAIGGGLDHMETVPVFPRPIQQQPWQQ
jgi:hypothetical protein